MVDIGTDKAVSDVLKHAFSRENPLVLAGAGKMGGAMLSGWLAAGINPRAVRVVDPSPPAESAALLAEAHIVADNSATSPEQARVLVVAVKPQIIEEACLALRPMVGSNTIVLSIAAGTRMKTLADRLGAIRVVRAMPNTPAQIGRGVTVAVGSPDIDAIDRELVTALLASIGKASWVADEADMDAVTAVSGSGPAYVFLLAEALAEAAVAAGLTPELAALLARETVAGAGELLARSNATPAELRENVTSPGGTTAAALEVLLGQGGLANLMTEAVLAAKRRSQELAG